MLGGPPALRTTSCEDHGLLVYKVIDAEIPLVNSWTNRGLSLSIQFLMLQGSEISLEIMPRQSLPFLSRPTCAGSAFWGKMEPHHPFSKCTSSVFEERFPITVSIHCPRVQSILNHS